MIGAYAVGKKAVTFGYKRYGIPGAIASGGIALAGYLAVRRALRSATNGDDATIEEAIDAGEIRSAVEAEGLGAVTDAGTLENAVDADELGSALDVEELQSSVTEDVDEFTDDGSDEHRSDG